MSDDVGAALRREIRDRASGCCEFCRMPDNEPVFPHEPDHIIAFKHHGKIDRNNLAYACFVFNRTKGSDIASIDPLSGVLTPLFHPRQHIWDEHFRCNGPLVEPLTVEGRVTVMLLRINSPKRVAIRDILLQEVRYPGKC